MMNCSASLGGVKCSLRSSAQKEASLNIRISDIFWDLSHCKRNLIKDKCVFRFNSLTYIRLFDIKSQQSAHHQLITNSQAWWAFLEGGGVSPHWDLIPGRSSSQEVTIPPELSWPPRPIWYFTLYNQQYAHAQCIYLQAVCSVLCCYVLRQRQTVDTRREGAW